MDYTGYSLHWLATSDQYYHQFQQRLEDPNEIDALGYTLLHMAAYSHNDNSKVLQLLLDRGADVDPRTPRGHTPLHLAVARRKHEAVTSLIEAGASVNAKDFFGKTILHFAIGAKRSVPHYRIFRLDCDMWILERLLSRPEIIVSPVDNMGETPLMWAVMEGNFKAVRTLLKKGANPYIPDKGNRTPLHQALLALKPIYDIVYILLLSRAGIYCEDNSGQTPIDILLRNLGDEETLNFVRRCLFLIVFRYHIRKSLKDKMEKIPVLSRYFDRCCKEANLMKEMTIYGKFTLHDFGLNCFQAQVRDPVQEIYIPVVEILLSGLFRIYYHYLYSRLSMSDLQIVLARTAGGRFSLDQVPSASKFSIYEKIRHFYDEDFELKWRLRKYKDLI